MNYTEIVDKIMSTLQEMYPELTFKRTQNPSFDFSPPKELIWVRYYTLSDDGRNGPRRWDCEEWENILLLSTTVLADLECMVAKKFIDDVFSELIRYCSDSLDLFFNNSHVQVEEADEWKKYVFVKKEFDRND